ncbi:MAG: Cytosolic iron-sulfur protein assembly protein [Caeruleum heppii]|nr:MAG: Cytosolic iron-sulfur protein assembly protein [Caeruleum heppii]
MTSEDVPTKPPPRPAPSGSLTLLASLSPPSTTRSWLSAPHPHLPLVATCSSDRVVRVYSLRNFAQHSTVEGGHKRSIRSCAWKPGVKGESVLATGSFDASAGIWRRWDGDMVPRPEGAEQTDLSNGDAAGDEREEDDEWRFAVILDGHESEIKSVAWSTSGQFLATCSRDKSVWIWEELEDDNFETIAVLQDHEGDVKCVVWHPEEELLASASYDDTIRMYKEDVDDWTCVSVLRGHESTVWAVDFEPPNRKPLIATTSSDVSSSPRLVSSSDDQTIRIWHRLPKQQPPVSQTPVTRFGGITSSIRTYSAEEDWEEESQLPRRHDRAIYSVAWSKRSGRIVSTGSDGKIVVYEEKLVDPPSLGENGHPETSARSEWAVIAELPAAHGVFEINHVCWSKRWDKDAKPSAATDDEEEVIISTGDDGVVRMWTLRT